MQKRKMVRVICDNPNCDSIFEKPESEYSRNQQLGRKNFCSRKCVGQVNIKNFGDNANYQTAHLNPANRRDEFTGYRALLNRIRYRDPNHNITLEYLRFIFEKQEGRCAYTGIELQLPIIRRLATYSTASVDRIDSSIGYLQGNIQFVAMPINLMKRDMTHEKTIEFLTLIKQTDNDKT